MHDLDSAKRIAEYTQGWTQVNSRAFQLHGFSIHLIGKHDILLVGHGISEEMRFYDAAVTVMEWEERNAKPADPDSVRSRWKREHNA
jgi:hypothetical protein